MSLILDALKRADAERASGAVPDLHAQPLEAGAPAAAPRAAARRGLWAAAVALLVVAAAAAGWWLRSPAPADAARPAAAPAAPPAQARVPQPLPQAPVEVPAAAVAPPPAATVQARPEAVAVTPAAAPAAASAAAPTAPAPAAATPPAPPRPVAAESRVLTLPEAPEDLRRAVAALRFGGAVGSPDPKSRLLFVNGQMLHEGEEAAPGVMLRQIRTRSAVLESRGVQVEVPF